MSFSDGIYMTRELATIPFPVGSRVRLKRQHMGRPAGTLATVVGWVHEGEPCCYFHFDDAFARTQVWGDEIAKTLELAIEEDVKPCIVV